MLFSDMSQMKQSSAWKWTTCLPYSMQERGNTIVPLVDGLVFGRERGLARHFSIVLGNLLRVKKGTFCTYRCSNKSHGFEDDASAYRSLFSPPTPLNNKTTTPTHLVREVRAVLPRHTPFPGQAPSRVHGDGNVSGKQCRRRVADLNQQLRRRNVNGLLGGVVGGLSCCEEGSEEWQPCGWWWLGVVMMVVRSRWL